MSSKSALEQRKWGSIMRRWEDLVLVDGERVCGWLLFSFFFFFGGGFGEEVESLFPDLRFYLLRLPLYVVMRPMIGRKRTVLREHLVTADGQLKLYG